MTYRCQNSRKSNFATEPFPQPIMEATSRRSAILTPVADEDSCHLLVSHRWDSSYGPSETQQ